MGETLSWGIIGTGRIAHTFAEALRRSETARLAAVGSRRRESADAFGDEFDVPNRHGSYESLLADEAVEAVYISTPHPMHAEWGVKAARAGKHILCEKPLTLNYPEAMAVVEAARANDVFLMEAFMYRCHPQTAKLVELIRDGAIGEVRMVYGAFGFDAPLDPAGRLFSQELGGGGILDVGCYPVSMARLIAGAASGADFLDPADVVGVGRVGEVSRVDEWAAASLKFPNGVIAQVATAVRVNLDNTVRISGSEGWMLLPSPWGLGRGAGSTKILLHRRGSEQPEEIAIESARPIYTLEADTVAANLEQRQAPPPAMTWDDSLGNMRTLDRWREAIGLVYDSERPESIRAPVANEPLTVREGERMQYGAVAGLEQPVSRIAMGVVSPESMPYAAVMCDDYFERGGNCFDTGFIYGGGRAEALLGRWIESRGIRDRVIVADKAAHTPWNHPEHLAPQLSTCLERLRTDYIDIFMAHRDNAEVPVEEWVDAFDELVRAGRIRCYGVSNWSPERVEKANEYARRAGRREIAAVSNNFSLAHMVEPVWPGVLAASDPESRAWFERAQMPLFAWSSQAQGFFTGRADPEDRSNPELVRCWYSDGNFERLRRARELAAKRGVRANSIALAYVLHQQFPTFALIGPRSIAETRSSMEALEVELTPEEVRWLNLEA